MTIESFPIAPAFGARVEGVSLSTVTAGEFEQLYAIWQRHHVLLLREQELTDSQFERFSAMLGELDPPPNQGAGRKSVP
jgi:taurine dioxygenase